MFVSTGSTFFFFEKSIQFFFIFVTCFFILIHKDIFQVPQRVYNMSVEHIFPCLLPFILVLVYSDYTL